jgi:hypothetical protein
LKSFLFFSCTTPTESEVVFIFMLYKNDYELRCGKNIGATFFIFRLNALDQIDYITVAWRPIQVAPKG